jgi:hypothetical protein
MSAIYRAGRVIGHISRDPSCDNDACIAARENGRPWHVTPMGRAVTLPTYHYATRLDAGVALYRAMRGHHGRDPRLTVGEDVAWRA